MTGLRNFLDENALGYCPRSFNIDSDLLSPKNKNSVRDERSIGVEGKTTLDRDGSGEFLRHNQEPIKS